MTINPAIPDGGSAITVDWMQRALNRGGALNCPPIRKLRVEGLGTGVGLMGDLLRCHLTYRDDAAAAPDTVIVKLPSADPKSRQVSKRRALYRREFDYYRRLALRAPIRSPTLLYGDFDEGSNRFVLVLEDLRAMRAVDQVQGGDPAQARSAIRAIAALHGRYWGKMDEPSLAGLYDTLSPRQWPTIQVLYLACLVRCLERFGSLFSDKMYRLVETYGTRMAEHLREVASGPRTFVHGDFRLDNMFFGAVDKDDVAVFDWQASGLGAAVYDVGYFLGASVTTEVRRETERETLAEYHDIVCRMGAKDFSFDDCWRLYRQSMLTGLVVPVLMCGSLNLTDERIRQLAGLVLQRRLAAIDDLDAGELLPGRRRFFSRANAFATLSGCAYGAYKASRGLGRTAGG